MAINVSKTTAAVVLQGADLRASKLTASVVFEVSRVDASKLTAFVVLKEGDPDPYNNLVLVSKATSYAVLEPGTAGPLVFTTSAAADMLFTHSGGLRVSSRVAEVAQNTVSSARVAGESADALINSAAKARISYLTAEVLRSTAEITVQALTTSVAADILYAKQGGTRASSVYAEALMTAGIDGEDFGTVAVVN